MREKDSVLTCIDLQNKKDPDFFEIYNVGKILKKDNLQKHKRNISGQYFSEI